MTEDQYRALVARPAPRQYVDKSPHSILAVCTCGWRSLAGDDADAARRIHAHASTSPGHPTALTHAA